MSASAAFRRQTISDRSKIGNRFFGFFFFLKRQIKWVKLDLRHNLKSLPTIHFIHPPIPSVLCYDAKSNYGEKVAPGVTKSIFAIDICDIKAAIFRYFSQILTTPQPIFTNSCECFLGKLCDLNFINLFKKSVFIQAKGSFCGTSGWRLVSKGPPPFSSIKNFLFVFFFRFPLGVNNPKKHNLRQILRELTTHPKC